MGAACCVAAKDRTIINRPNSDVLQHNVVCLPSWSVRWDHRGRVAEEATSLNWLSDGVSRNDRLEIKYGKRVVGTASGSEEECLLEQTRTGQKSPVSERNAGTLRLPSSDVSSSRNIPAKVKVSTESSAVSNLPPLKMSPSLHSILSLPLSSQSLFLHTSSTPSRCAHPSPTHHLLRQASDSRSSGHKSSNYSISEETSFSSFPEFMETSHRGERSSFGSESFGLYRKKIITSISRISVSPSTDMQNCGVCSKLVTDRSSWYSCELAVVSVLICGHVYHSECLENITAEINKYDPSCPVCTFGEKQAPIKFSEKAVKVITDLKVRKKRSKNRIMSSDLDGDSVPFDGEKSTKSSVSKPFLRRHFSFGSKGTRSLSETHSTQKKGFFWSKYRKQ